jgi:hypothetical protein
MNHYRNDWNNSHKTPSETLNIMEKELKGSSIKNRADKILNILNSGPSRQEVKDNNEDINIDYIRVKPGVNIENLTAATKSFIKEVGKVAKSLNEEVPVITSGWRSLTEQAKLMSNNWNNNGGVNGGRKYLINLYGRKYGSEVANILDKYGLTDESINLVSEVVKKYGSHHILSPGQAVDFRLTSNIKKILLKVKETDLFDMKIVNETNTAGPHYHVSIYGFK